jgi:hypothetical protein
MQERQVRPRLELFRRRLLEPPTAELHRHLRLFVGMLRGRAGMRGARPVARGRPRTVLHKYWVGRAGADAGYEKGGMQFRDRVDARR